MVCRLGEVPSVGGWVLPLAIVSIVVPLFQTAACLGSFGLNANEDSSESVRQRAWHRWKQVARRTPIATALMVLCFPLVIILILVNGGMSVGLTGATRENRVLIGTAGILFGYAPAYVNLFVVRKCQDLFASWSSGRAPTRRRRRSASKPSRSVSRRDRIIAGALCLVFLAVGLFAFTTLFVLPTWKVFQARSWNPTRCTIVSNKFREESDGDGTSYHLDVVYEYEVKEAVYRSDRFQFVGGGGLGGHRREFAKAFPPGSTTTCYVNPYDPTNVVLNRTMTADIWMNSLTLVLIVLGGGGFLLVTGIVAGKRSCLQCQVIEHPPFGRVGRGSGRGGLRHGF